MDQDLNDHDFYGSVGVPLKSTTNEEKISTNATKCLFSGRQFEDTFEKAQWRKVKEMQPMHPLMQVI